MVEIGRKEWVEIPVDTHEEGETVASQQRNDEWKPPKKGKIKQTKS